MGFPEYSPVIKGLRFNKITSKGFLANLKSLGHVCYRDKKFTKMSLGKVPELAFFKMAAEITW